MSKTTKRFALVLLLLCLSLGGAVLYRHRAGSPEGKREAAAGEPAKGIAPAPTPATAPAPSIAPTSPSEERAGAGAGTPSGDSDERPRVRRPPHDGQPAPPKKALAVAKKPGDGSKPDVSVDVTVLPQRQFGDVAIEIRPRLGAAVQAFQIVKITAFIDGREVAEGGNKNFWQGKEEIELWQGSLEAREHVLNVVVEYHGNSHSVFSYFDSYHYTARSSTPFRVGPGAQIEVMVDLVDKGGVNTAFEKRLMIAFAQR